MKNLLFMQENEFSGATSLYPSAMQPLYTHVNKLVTSNFQICFPAPYLSLHAKYSHMPDMPRGRTSPGLPYHYRWAIIGPPAKRDNGPTLNAGMVACDFSGDLDQYCLETLFLWFLKGGGGSGPPVPPWIHPWQPRISAKSTLPKPAGT